MSRLPARFTKTDIRRAIEAANAAGGVWAVEILPNGTIRLRPAEKLPTESTPVDEDEVIPLC